MMRNAGKGKGEELAGEWSILKGERGATMMRWAMPMNGDKRAKKGN